MTALLQSIDKRGEGIRVEFKKQGDRFEHAIFGIRGEERPLLLNSIEGTPNDFSPPSPPFAELHQQDDILFLSGATTLGHWSMSVQVVEGRLLFDVACRAHKEISHLGCTYRVHASGVDASEYALELGAATTSELKDGTLYIGSESSTAQKFPTTFQWQFSFGA